MRSSRLALAALVSLMPCLTLLGQQRMPQKDAAALQIAAQSLVAMGKLDPAQLAIKAEGKIEFQAEGGNPAKIGTIQIVTLGPRIFRTTVVREEETYSYVVNSGDGYVILNGKKRYLSVDGTFGERCAYFPFYTFLGEVNASDLHLIAPQAGQLDAKQTTVLTARYIDDSDPELEAFSEATIDIDPASFLPVRYAYTLRHAQNSQIAVKMEYSYDDFRRVGPYLFPHVIREFSDGQLRSVISISSIELNAALTLSEFSVR